MNEELSKIAQKYEAKPEDVQNEFDKQVKHLTDVLGMSKADAERDAIGFVRAAFRGRKVKKTAAFEGVIIGTDGRLSDWAEFARKDIREKMKGLSQEQAVAQGFINEKNEMLYDEGDEFRAGRVIPKEDIAQNFYGIFAENGAPKFTVIEVKNRDVISKLKTGMQIEVDATKMQKSNDKVLMIRIREDFKHVKDIPREKIVEYAQKYVKWMPVIEDLKALKNTFVGLKGFVVRSVRYEVGANKATVLEVDPGNTDEYDTISVWMPPKNQIGVNLQKGLPLNICGSVGQLKEGTLSFNGAFAFYDKVYEPKLVPQPIKDEGVAKTTAKTEQKLDW